MNFLALTIFPEMFEPFWAHGMIRRALEANIISASAIDIRDFTADKHRTTDDRPYGGGCGMVMKPEPLAAAIRAAKGSAARAKTILMSPQGEVFNQNVAGRLAAEEALILVCGRYEGIDERIISNYIDAEISIGDFVLTGGELAAMTVMDAVTRLLPGALGGETSAADDSFSNGLLEHAHYTRPRDFENLQVPEVLLSGDHRAIADWRLESSLIRTFLKRRDLLENRTLDPEHIKILKKWCKQIESIIQARSAPGAGSSPGRE